MKQKLTDMVPIVLNRFDFRKVHEVMVFMRWKWAIGTEFRIPTSDELRGAAEEYLLHCVKKFEGRGRPNTGMAVECGGLRAEVLVFPDGTESLELMFCIESYSTQNTWNL